MCESCPGWEGFDAKSNEKLIKKAYVTSVEKAVCRNLRTWSKKPFWKICKNGKILENPRKIPKMSKATSFDNY